MSKPYSSGGPKGSAIRAVLLANPDADRAAVAQAVGCTVSRVGEVVGAMREAGELADPNAVRLRWADRVGDEVVTLGHGTAIVTETLAILAERLEAVLSACDLMAKTMTYGELAQAVRSPWGPNQRQFGVALDLAVMGWREDGREGDPSEWIIRKDAGSRTV